MRLVDLDPRWLLKDGARIGFVFRSPTNRAEWQSCFETPPQTGEQCDLFDDQVGEDEIVQPCNPAARWAVEGGLAAASFETMSVKPSLDGSAGGLWHGCITNGDIVGGI